MPQSNEAGIDCTIFPLVGWLASLGDAPGPHAIFGEGGVVLSTDPDLESSSRGYLVRLLGFLEYSPQQKVLEKFKAVALGDHWGEGTYTRGARPGGTPLGVAFEMVTSPAPSDLVQPQGALNLSEYYRPHSRN